MQELILSRHAESTANVEGIVCAEPTCSVDLTDEGRHQAKRLAQVLEGEDIALCVTGELSRSLKTADIALAGVRFLASSWPISMTRSLARLNTRPPQSSTNG
jgi:broad specificity phosphatase PhoE